MAGEDEGFVAAAFDNPNRPPNAGPVDLFAYLLWEDGTPIRQESGQGLIKLEESP